MPYLYINYILRNYATIHYYNVILKKYLPSADMTEADILSEELKSINSPFTKTSIPRMVFGCTSITSAVG